MKNLFLNKKFQFPIVLFLIGLILMISADIIFPKEDTDNITDNSSSNQGNTGQQNLNSSSNTDADKKELETQIQKLIESIGSVKSASVVITYENSGELSTVQDGESGSKSTKEKDGSGGDREITEESNKDETIYIEGSDGSKYPFVSSEKYAEVRGVAVVVKGTYDESTREKIIRALEVLLNLPTHKIQVIW